MIGQDDDLLDEISEFPARPGLPKVCMIPDCGCSGLAHSNGPRLDDGLSDIREDGWL